MNIVKIKSALMVARTEITVPSVPTSTLTPAQMDGQS